MLPPPSRNYLCYVGVFLLATTLPVEATRVSLHETKRERERETPLIRRRRRMRFNIGWPVRGRGQLGKGSWSRWDTRTYDPRPLLVPLTNVSWHPPGHGPPPRGPPSSLNSRLGCIRDTGTRAQPNPESPLLPETVETVQLLAGSCSCLVIAYYLKGEGWYLKRYAKRVLFFFWGYVFSLKLSS